jgi:hypothetical protein
MRDPLTVDIRCKRQLEGAQLSHQSLGRLSLNPKPTQLQESSSLLLLQVVNEVLTQSGAGIRLFVDGTLHTMVDGSIQQPALLASHAHTTSTAFVHKN